MSSVQLLWKRRQQFYIAGMLKPCVPKGTFCLCTCRQGPWQNVFWMRAAWERGLRKHSLLSTASCWCARTARLCVSDDTADIMSVWDERSSVCQYSRHACTHSPSRCFCFDVLNLTSGMCQIQSFKTSRRHFSCTSICLCVCSVTKFSEIEFLKCEC